MSFRREILRTALAVLTAGWCVNAFAQPVFEGRTPRGFSPSDSTVTTTFITGEDVTILVDLNEAATQSYPVIANFQTLEKSVPFFSGTFQDSISAYMSQAIAVDDFGFIHRAWIQQRGEINATSTTPVYGVVYAKSVNGGNSFLDTVSVSGTLRFDMITPNLGPAAAAAEGPTSGFSTVDLVVDSRGNPRVTYAMDFSPDGLHNSGGSCGLAAICPPQTHLMRTGAREYNNIFFNFSNDGGSSWLPQNGAVVINDSATVIGRNTAFPRMAITATDDIFIVYERDLSASPAATDGSDIMLAKVDADSLTGGAAQAVIVGSTGLTTSRGGVRLDQDLDRGVSPDIAIGDDDVIHVVWYNSTENDVEHKTNQAKLWANVTASGWDNIVSGAVGGMGLTQPLRAALTTGSSDRNAFGPHALSGTGLVHLFPTVVVDKQATLDVVYALWKTSQQLITDLEDENIGFSSYAYDGQVGAPTSAWPTTASNVFPTGTGATDEAPLFQNNTAHQIEGHWTFVDRVSAVVDDRLSNRGDLHILFAAGPTSSQNLTHLGTAAAGLTSPTARANNIYYTRFNGVEWELPQVVASARHQETQHDAGVLQKHAELFGADLAVRSGDDNVYMTFVGGSQTGTGRSVATTRTPGANAGRGYSALSESNVSPRPYFKVIGRVASFNDRSIPAGGFQYHLAYSFVNPQTGATGATGTLTSENMVVVTAADNVNGSGIGFTTPSSSKAPGGFLTGQWTNVGRSSLGVSSLNPTANPATFVAKGASNNIEATGDNGVFEGQTDDDGSSGYAEWGDKGDKNGLLVKLNVLGSDSSTNLFVIRASTPALVTTGGGTSQSVSLTGRTASATFVKGVRRNITTLVTAFDDDNQSGTPPVGGVAQQHLHGLGSYFQMGANITIISANTGPVVSVVKPDASTTGFANESFVIQYIIFDTDDDVGNAAGATATDSLQMELYFYPDNGLSTVQDVQVFATRIVDENDAFTTATPAGTGDFSESTSSSNTQSYTWDDPGSALQNQRGFASIKKTLDGDFFIYAVADDGVNPPVFDVSDGPVSIKHIPVVSSISPVATDTVDTGEFDVLANTNPYTVKFDLIDFNDNAVIKLFYSTDSGLDVTDASVTVTTFPTDVTIDLANATEIQLSDTLRTDDDSEFDFDITAQGSTQDSVVAQGNYFIYAVVADKDSFVVGKSALTLAVRHSPAFEFTAPMKGEVRKLNVSQQFKYTLQWQRGRSDRDADNNANIAFYYTGVDPDVFDYSGTDSTKLVATTGADSGLAILITGGIKEDDEGAGDQFVWDFKNPPGELPKVFRPKFVTGSGVGTQGYSVHAYQHGETTDTAWVYAVLNDGTGNTRVQAGGAVLLIGSQESPASNAPKVTMKTPPSGGQTIINGDIIRLEWDAFLIDDGTGTDDAYLRLYAAPENLYTTLTQLETNMSGVGGAQDVLLINSLTANDLVSTNVQEIRESDASFFNWDTKTRSFPALAGGSRFDIFIAASTDVTFGESIFVNGVLDNVASGLDDATTAVNEAQRAVLSRAPGTLTVLGNDPIYSIEMGPAALTASSGDTLDFDIHINSQGSSTDQFALFLNVPRNYFEVIDQDAVAAGVQPFVDSVGAFQAPSTIAQNDTTQGTAQFLKLNFVEASPTGEVIGKVTSPFDSSQVSATLKLKVKQYAGGATQDTVLQWSTEPGRETKLYRGLTSLAAPTRDASVTLVPRSRLIVTVPLQGRSGDFADTIDVHLREIGSTQDITDQDYIRVNDIDTVVVDTVAGTLGNSVRVASDNFGTFQLFQIPTGAFELTVKAPGYVSGRSDTLNLFNGLTQAIEPTFGSDLNGDLSPATALGFLLGGDATGDNQIDIADANLIFSLWNLTPADSLFVRDADINNDGVINGLDLGFSTTNFNVFGAPPVFKKVEGGDNGSALVKIVGIEDVDGWWPGREFEVHAVVEGMADVAAYDLRVTYETDKVKPLAASQAVEQGDVFDQNPNGSLFFHMVEPGQIEAAAGRIGYDWSARGDAELVTLRFVTLGDDPGVIDVASRLLVNSNFEGMPMKIEKAAALPKFAALYQNYPNPFNPSTEINFDLPAARDVKLRIYNQLGQTVRTLVDNRMKAGRHSLKWDGSDDMGRGAASGVYFFNLEAGDFSQIRKMMLVK